MSSYNFAIGFYSRSAALEASHFIPSTGVCSSPHLFLFSVVPRKLADTLNEEDLFCKRKSYCVTNIYDCFSYTGPLLHYQLSTTMKPLHIIHSTQYQACTSGPIGFFSPLSQVRYSHILSGIYLYPLIPATMFWGLSASVQCVVWST